MDKDGNISTDYISVFSPYVDEVLIPQLLELYDEYEIDGAWIDGECWGAKADYGKFAQARYLEMTGQLPPLEEEKRAEYEDFCRQGFRDYVHHYFTVIKEKRPDFEITSNWIYSKGSLYSMSDFSGYTPLCGWISALSNNQIPTSVLYEYQLLENLSQYKSIVLPSSKDLEKESKEALLQYVREGGHLILDSRAALHFQDVLVPEIAYEKENRLCFPDGGTSLCCVDAPVLSVCEEPDNVSGYYYHSNIYEKNREIAGFTQSLGKGRLLVLCVDVGRTYCSNIAGTYNSFLVKQPDMRKR